VPREKNQFRQGYTTSKTRNLMKSPSCLLPLASERSFNEVYAKPLRAPSLMFCHVSFWLAVSRNLRSNFVFQMNPCIPNFLLLVVFSHKFRVGACKARQCAYPRFMSVVCGYITPKRINFNPVLAHEEVSWPCDKFCNARLLRDSKVDDGIIWSWSSTGTSEFLLEVLNDVGRNKRASDLLLLMYCQSTCTSQSI
jgi:hypothetical protein